LTKCSLHLMFTRCVWSKNYRLQSIQLSKSPKHLSPSDSRSRARSGHSTRRRSP
jgi:hypothetical protein